MKTESFLRSITAVLSTAVFATNIANVNAASDVNVDEPVEYGVDISFPIHNAKVSTNYPWLPHNVDPANNPTPKEYENMPIQYLGNVQQRYDDFMQGCRDHYNKRPRACDQTEKDRISMSLRQVS